MNRLALAQRLQIECGVSGTLSTTIGQTGSLGRLVNWIDAAWNDIQTEHEDWEFLRSSNLLGGGVSFTSVAGQASYPLGTGAGTVGLLATSFGTWDRYSFRNYTTSVGTGNEMFLDPIPYDSWRDGYMLGAMRAVQTRPVAVAIGPDKSVCLGPPTAVGYTITGDYFTAPTAMATDTDSPTGLPAQFHMAIVYKAMMKYATYESAPEVMTGGQNGYNPLFNELEARYAPEVTTAPALA